MKYFGVMIEWKMQLNSVKNNSQLEKIKINFKVIDHNSSKQNLEKINSIFKSVIAIHNNS